MIPHDADDPVFFTGNLDFLAQRLGILKQRHGQLLIQKGDLFAVGVLVRVKIAACVQRERLHGQIVLVEPYEPRGGSVFPLAGFHCGGLGHRIQGCRLAGAVQRRIRRLLFVHQIPQVTVHRLTALGFRQLLSRKKHMLINAGKAVQLHRRINDHRHGQRQQKQQFSAVFPKCFDCHHCPLPGHSVYSITGLPSSTVRSALSMICCQPRSSSTLTWVSLRSMTVTAVFLAVMPEEDSTPP